MALQATISFENGITLQEAYVIIEKITINYTNPTVASIVVLIYKDSTAYNDGKTEVITLTHSCAGDDYTTYFAESVLDEAFKNPLTQGYAYLQTLPFYGGAVII